MDLMIAHSKIARPQSLSDPRQVRPSQLLGTTRASSVLILRQALSLLSLPSLPDQPRSPTPLDLSKPASTIPEGSLILVIRGLPPVP